MVSRPRAAFLARTVKDPIMGRRRCSPERSQVQEPKVQSTRLSLMQSAGFRKGSDGTYLNSAGNRFATEARATSTADLQKELSIMASQWRQAGFDVQEVAVPLAQAQDG